MSATCRYCGNETPLPCRSTRDMEDAGKDVCTTSLMLAGGGEMTVNRLASEEWIAILADPKETGCAALGGLLGAGLLARNEFGGLSRTAAGDLAMATIAAR